MGLGWTQFKAHTWKSMLLLSKSWRVTATLILLVPILSLGAVGLGQWLALSSSAPHVSSSPPSSAAASSPLGSIPPCSPSPTCINLAYAPKNHAAFAPLVRHIARTADWPPSSVRGFPDAAALEHALARAPNSTALALTFVEDALPDLQFVVWYNSSLEAATAGCHPPLSLADPQCANVVPAMRVQAQAAVLEAALTAPDSLFAPRAGPDMDVLFQLRPLTAAPGDERASASVFVGVVCVLFLCSAGLGAGVLVTLVAEKTSGARSLMYVHGLYNWVFWVSWGGLAVLAALVMTALQAAVLRAVGIRLASCSAPALLFSVTALYNVTTVAMACAVSVLVWSVSVAMGLAVSSTLLGLVLVQLLASIDMYALWGNGGSPVLWLSLVFPPFHLVKVLTDINTACSPLYAADRASAPSYPWSHLSSPVAYGPSASPNVWPASTSLMILAGTAVTAVLFVWFVDSWVRLQDALFCCRPSYYLTTESSGVEPAEVLSLYRETTGGPDVESEVSSLLALSRDAESPALKVFKVAKTYGPDVALKDVSFGVTMGSMLAVLGASRSGKSTLLSILTGQTAASSGDAEILGHALSRDVAHIRGLIGYMPQTDVMWPSLTPAEVLTLFGALKGLGGPSLNSEVASIVHQLQLEPTVSTPLAAVDSCTRRKVSLAAALIGSPRAVFLDSPTAGLDAMGRRTVWRLLQRQKPGRVIVLATNSMAEAQALGDKIGILSRGSLAAIGSGAQFKASAAAGHRLVLNAADDSHATLEPVIAAVTSAVPASSVLSARGPDIEFVLPPHIEPAAVANIFDALDPDLVIDWSIRHVSSLEVTYLNILNPTPCSSSDRTPLSS